MTMAMRRMEEEVAELGAWGEQEVGVEVDTLGGYFHNATWIVFMAFYS